MPTDAVDPSLNPNSAYYLSNNDLNTSKLINIVFDANNKHSRFQNLEQVQRFVNFLDQKLCDLNQEDDEQIFGFFTKIKLLWDQLDGLDPLPSCVCTGCNCTLTQKLLKVQQNQRMIQFLMKLNQKYDHSKSTILMMSQLPTISKAYGLFLQEEQQKQANNNRKHNLESTLLTVRKFTDNRPYKSSYGSNSGTQNTAGGNQPRNFTNTRNNLFCEHCKMKNHTVDKSCKLHGYPKDFKGKGKRVAAATQLEEFTEMESPNEADRGVVHATFTENSGASDHMCSDKSMYSKLKPVNDKHHTIPDGTELQICPLPKQTRFPFSISGIKSVQPFDLLHIDVWGPYSVHDSSRCNQFLTIVDDYTRMTWTHLMRNKTDSVKIMSDFLLYVENQFGLTVKAVRSDNAPDLTKGGMK
ncbi:uncharacterized protein [Spinacia oleracea]|uniref:Integrase catalytic domain-containing protein n=1 Tax=Spinacia oleracea TaxID=3562 RepID=A0ABM3QRN2_SPIOL|nr:uncharacterized protein LOC130461812 [Spinacia oleracea]